ncbi:hypothetical protein [Streptomyces mirabilis]|uniref:hypothetical protein n=1 Tax=Streptomyces mirabilis TaxID=68239 RepID=UPI0033A7E712
MNALTQPYGERAGTGRARCILRVHFHEVRDPALLDQLLTLIEDFTPVWQPLPPDTVDVDLIRQL